MPPPPQGPCDLCGGVVDPFLTVNIGSSTPQNRGRIQRRCSGSGCPFTIFYTPQIQSDNPQDAFREAEAITKLINSDPSSSTFFAYFPQHDTTTSSPSSTFSGPHSSSTRPSAKPFQRRVSYHRRTVSMSDLDPSLCVNRHKGLCTSRSKKFAKDLQCRHNRCSPCCIKDAHVLGPCDVPKHRPAKVVRALTSSDNTPYPSSSTAASSTSVSKATSSSSASASRTLAHPVQNTWTQVSEGVIADRKRVVGERQAETARKREITIKVWRQAGVGPDAIQEPVPFYPIFKLDDSSASGLLFPPSSTPSMRLCAQIFAPEKRTWVITAAGASRTLSGAETELLIRAMPNGIGGPYLQDQDCLELPPYARSKKRAHSPSDPSEQPPLKRVPSSPIPSSPVPASPPLPCRKGSLRRIMSSPGPVRSDGSGGSTLLRVDPRARAPADTARLSVVARLGIQDLAQNDWLPSILEFEEGDTEIDNPEVKPPSPTTASCVDHAISTNDAVEGAAVLPSAAVATTPTPTTMPTPPPTIPIHIPSDAHLQDTPSESPSPIVTSRRFNSRSRSSSSTTLKFPSEFSFSAIWKGVEEVNKAVVVEPKKGGPRETQSSAVLRVFGLRTCGASTFRYVVQVLHMGSPATWKRYLALGSSTAAAFGNYRHEVRGASPDAKLPWEDGGVALDSAGSPASSASPSPPPQLFYEGAALPSPSSSLSGTTSMSSPALPSQIEESSGISSPANAILSNTRNGSLSGPDTFTNLGGAHGVAFDYAATQSFGDLFALLDGTAIAPSSMDDAALFADDMAPRTSTDNLLHTHTEISTFSPTGDSVPIEDWQPWDYGAFIPTPNTLQAINEAIS